MREDDERLLSYMDAKSGELYGLLSGLVRFDSQNFVNTGREQAVQTHIAELCRAMGLETELYNPDDVPGIQAHPGYLPGRGVDKRPDVSALWRGSAPRRRIMLAAHADTMPVGDESLWSVPPLGGLIRDGNIYGRGSGDDKAGLAAALYAIRCLRETGVRLKDDVCFTSYADEEYGGGDGALAACLKYPSDIYVNLDGMDMTVNPWGVGGGVVEIDLWTNHPVSSGWPTYNGVEVFMENLKAFAAKRYAEMDASPVYHGTEEYRDTMRVGLISVGDNCSDLGRAKVSFVYYTLSDRETVTRELTELRDKTAEALGALDMSIGPFRETSRFFLPVLPAGVGADARLLADTLGELRGTETKCRGFCLSDLSIFANYGGGAAFNFGAGQTFAEKGGFHQPDEYVKCRDLLDEAKALALYLVRRAG